MRKIILITVVSLLILIGCARQAVQEEPVTEETIIAPPVPPEEVHAPEPVAPPEEIEETLPEETVVEEPVPEEVSVDTLKQIERKIEGILELVEVDSVDIFYMVRPNDYLIKIAKKEYGLANMWRQIYKWNWAKIGDNPNLIYPFHEFLLKKPADIARPVEYDFYEYNVEKNESLWSIAGKEYGNNYAWIVILKDNADVLGSDLENIPVDMVLKLRTRIW